MRLMILAFLCLLAPGLARADWHEAQSKHFIVYSDDSPERVKQYTERLERFDAALRWITGTKDRPLSPHLRVTVFVVRDMSAVQRLYGGRNVAGFFIPRASGSVAFVPRKDGDGLIDAQTILQHEYGHNFMFSTWPGVVFAPWYVEGWGEFVGTALLNDNGSVTFGKAPVYRSYSLMREALLPASRLVRLDPGRLSTEQRGVLYARGWLLTHYLLLGGHSDQFIAYIRAVNAGKPIDEANRAFGDIGGLDGRMNAYAKKPNLPALPVKADEIPIAPVTLRTLTAGEAAVMPARIASSRGVDAGLAKEVVALARRLAAPFPNDAGAQNALAEAEYDAGDYAAAEAAADRALAADPQSMHAMLYKGMAMVARAKADKTAGVGQWKAARGWFLKANKLDTEYPEPLIRFHASFRDAGQPPTKGAQDGLIYAYALAPYEPGLRMAAGRLLLARGETEAAKVAFEPVAFGAHGGSLAETARKVLEALDAGGATAAAKVLDDAAGAAGKADGGDAGD
jgi:tetratricopeptide (TPR) repeat protein